MSALSEMYVLFITNDFSRYVQRSFHYFAVELAKLVNLTVWRQTGHIQDIVSRLPRKPDFILLNEYFQGGHGHCPAIEGLSEIDIPLGVIAHDIHNRTEERRQFYLNNRIQYVFSIYRNAFVQAYPQLTDRMHWLPHFVDTNVFHDYKMPKDIDFLLLGCMNRTVYPLRRLMLTQLREHPNFVHKKHPGYRNFTIDEDNDYLIGEAYARAINRAKIFLTCDSIYHYPLRKYYEVLACRTLLLAPCFSELLELGFVPYKHFVPVSERDFFMKASYYLHNEAERQRIADAGFTFVHENHSAKHRAMQFLQSVETILAHKTDKVK